MNELLLNGCELMDNVRLAADRLQIQHRDRIERRDELIKQIMEQDNAETELEFEQIQQRWPNTDVAKYQKSKVLTICLQEKAIFFLILEMLPRTFLRKSWNRSRLVMLCWRSEMI